MSSGIAYVWDPEGHFANLCNRNEVELEQIAAIEPDDDVEPGDWPRQRAPSVHDNGMGDPLRFDAARLRILLERHHLFTGSARARALLEDWDNTVASFVKITPKDYRRALLELQAEQLAARTEAAE
jgi:glutamate synthase (NADPH/NADH) large chain